MPSLVLCYFFLVEMMWFSVRCALLLLTLLMNNWEKSKNTKNKLTEKSGRQPYELITIHWILAEKRENRELCAWWLISQTPSDSRIERHMHNQQKIEKHKRATVLYYFFRDRGWTDWFIVCSYVFIANDFYSLLCLFVSVFGK